MVRVFEKSEHVVTPSGSCCAMIHDYYGELLGDDPRYADRAQRLISKSHEFIQFLVHTLKVDLRELGCRWPNDGSTAPTTYHYSCHLRGIGVSDEAVQLLQQIEGVEYIPLERMDQCCGFGGTFAVKYPEISGAMVEDKVARIAESGARVVVCNDGGCAMNIHGACNRRGVNVQVRHLAEIIAEGLGLMEPLTVEGEVKR
jgi:L-lactate dehydrogenase complex protein LldE